jgi:formamidopyrimidine-DNA glycosylase
LKVLHEKIHSVCGIAAGVLGDSSKFPTDWLFSYRWGKSRTKGKKGQEERDIMPNGEKIKHITVGGRTSAVVESRQKKIKSNTDGDEEDEDEEEKTSPPKQAKKAKKADDVEVKSSKSKSNTVKKHVAGEATKRKAKEEFEDENVTPKKRRVSGGEKKTQKPIKETPTRKSSRRKA